MQNLLFNFETKILLELKREVLKEEEKRWRECECTVRARERVCAPPSVFEKECVWVRTRERERERETGKKPECPSLRFSSWRQTQTSRWRENKLFLALGKKKILIPDEIKWYMASKEWPENHFLGPGFESWLGEFFIWWKKTEGQFKCCQELIFHHRSIKSEWFFIIYWLILNHSIPA